jgi:hypothetical protein
LQFIVARSRARDLGENFPFSSANYSKAVARLKLKVIFGRDMLVEVYMYVREILQTTITPHHAK